MKDLRPLVGKPLEKLCLNYLTVTPDLAPLAEISTLASLSLIGTTVKEAQVADPQDRLPDLHISR